MKKAQKEEALRTFEIPADFQAAYKSLEDYLKTYAYRNYQEKIKDGAKFDDMRDFFIERCRYVMKYFDEIAHYGLLDFSNLTLADSFFLNMNVKNNFVSKLQFSSKFLSKMQSLQSQQKEYVIGYLYCYESELQKIKTHSQKNESAPKPLTKSLDFGFSNLIQFYQHKLSVTGKIIVSAKFTERVPELDPHNRKIKQYNYHTVYRMIDIISDNDKKSVDRLLYEFYNECLSDPDRLDEPDPKLSKRSYKDDSYYIYLTPEEAQELKYYGAPIYRWARQIDVQKRLNYNNQVAVAQMNAGILSTLADFESASKLVKILEKIPNFKIKLTTEERKVIGQDGNVLALGRSGTGKTTCAVLRLFSQDMLFKIRMKKSTIQMKLKDMRFEDEEGDEMSFTGIHSIFVTASPVLCNEVSRYYKRLSDKVTEEINKRRQEKKSNQNSDKDTEEKVEENKTEEKFSEITTEKKEKKEEPENNENKESEEKLEEIDENEYLMDEDEAEAMTLMNKNVNLVKIEDKEFPLFLTVRRLVLMLDGTLQTPFFARDKNNDIISSNTRAQWHNEMKGAMIINNKFRGKETQEEPEKNDENPDDELVEAPEDFGKDDVDALTEEEIEAEYERYQAILRKRSFNDEKLIKKTKFEIDYEYFVNHFWPSHSSRFNRKVSPLLVWSEFMATIKGSADSFTHDRMALPQSYYLTMSVEGSILNKENREQIYACYTDYEAWKTTIGGYDFMDVVNNALRQIDQGGYTGAPIHFIMIDEVQDLSHATISLLMKVTEQGVFFAGDTAQTIAKGVGVRFSDLKSLFKGNTLGHLSFKAPSVHQLTVNFRSHGKILDIANSVVSLIEAFFPATIDKLKKEKSEIDGPKPILLDGVDIEVLFAILFGTETYKSIRQSQSSGGLLDKPPIEFGCNQVIIVRDQEAKDKLPSILKHALCLTVYEAKGLEFDQVILFNFFADSKVSADEWKLMEDALIESKQVTKEVFEKFFFTYKEEKEDDEDLNSLEIKGSSEGEGESEKLNKNDVNLFNSDFDAKTGMYILKKVILAKKFYGRDMTNFSLICNELKQLYVALTRPRNRIIIYDEDVYKRTHLESYWKQLNLVEVITKDVLEVAEKTENITNKEVSSFKALIKSTGASEWKLQGLKMFRNKFYSQAYKCFQHSGDKELSRRCEAYMLAEQASDKMSKINAERSFINEGVQIYAGMPQRDKNKYLKKLKIQEQEQYAVFIKAADMFMEINLPKHAGRCCFSALEYKKAVEIFEKAEMYREAGEASWMMKEYFQAGELFTKGKDYMRAIECYEKCHNYEKILNTIDLYTDLPPKDKKILANKYVPMALKSLTDKVEFQEAKDTKKEDGVIEENDSEDDEEEKEGDIITIKKEEVPLDVEEISFDQISKKDMSDKINEITLDGPSSTKAQEKKPEKELSEISFVDVASKSETSSYVKVEENLDNFDHLSEFDFKDEFLKVETGSVIESIATLRKKKSEISSDFSAVGFNQLITDFHLVKTKTDIFIQDDVMNKIIKYVERFREEFVEDLNQMKTTRVLLSNELPSINQLTENYIDFDNITKEFLFFILDFLEKNNLHKLCIFVCNRYNLADKLGRYLCNLAFNYSPFTIEGRNPTTQKLYNPRFSKIQQEKGYVANLAVHNILEIINPAYISFKKKGEAITETNSLDTMSFFKLISLGFWKKVLFIMDYQNSLALASTFASFESYKLIYLTGHPSCEDLIKAGNVDALLKQNDFEFLPFKTPENKDEIELSIIALDSVVWGINEKFPVSLYRDYNPETHRGESLNVPTFPSYLAYNDIFWDYVINKKPEMKDKFIEYLLSACDNLERILGTKEFKSEVIELRIYDIITFLVQVIILYQSNHTVADVVNTIPVEQLIKFMNAYKNLLTYAENLAFINKYAEIVIRALTSPFRVRTVPMTSVLCNFGACDFIVHKGSPIMDDLIHKPETLMMDVEGNFIKASRDRCLKAIRRRILIRLKMIVYYRIQGKVANVHPQIGVSDFDSVVKFKTELEQQAKWISLISIYDYCHSLHYGPNTYKKKPKVIAQAEENPEEDEYEELELGDNRRKKVKVRQDKDSYRSGGGRMIISLNEPVEMITKISTNDSDYPFISYKYHLVKSFMSKLNSYIGIRLNLDIYTKNYMTEIALKKLKNSFANQSIKPKILNMFHILGKDILLTERLRKSKDEMAEDISLYHDSIYYRLHGCSEDYFYNMTSFLRNTYKFLKPENMIYILENLTSNLIISKAIGANLKAKEVYMPLSLSKNIDMLKTTGENEKLLEKNILPMNDKETYDDFISFLNDTVQELDEQEEELSKRYARLLISIVVNDIGMSDSSAVALNEAFHVVRSLIPNNLSKIQTAHHFKLFAQEFKSKSKEDKSSLIKFLSDSFVLIKINSDSKAAEKNHEISDKAYNRDVWKIAQKINLKIALHKLYKKHRNNRLRSRDLVEPYKTSYLTSLVTSPTFASLKTQEFKRFFQSIDIRIEYFSALATRFNSISEVLATNYQFNTFEYTYVLYLLMTLAQYGQDIQSKIEEAVTNKKTAVEIHTNACYSESRAKIETMMKEYREWWATRTQNNKEASRSSQALKLTRVKWQEEAFMLRMQKIAKKRRAILKRDMLQDRAFFKKN